MRASGLWLTLRELKPAQAENGLLAWRSCHRAGAWKGSGVVGAGPVSAGLCSVMSGCCAPGSGPARLRF